jgi:hypothetical protein
MDAGRVVINLSFDGLGDGLARKGSPKVTGPAGGPSAEGGLSDEQRALLTAWVVSGPDADAMAGSEGAMASNERAQRPPEGALLVAEPSDEVISPELALIDPELAQRARALLPTYGYERSERVADLHVEPEARAVPEAEGQWTPPLREEGAAATPSAPELWPAARTQRRVGRLVRQTILAVALVVLIVTGLAGAAPSRESRPGIAARQSPPRAATRPPSVAASPAQAASGRATPRRTAVPPKRRSAQRSTAAGLPAPVPRGSGAAAGSPSASRAFAWSPTAGAAHYEVEFYRAGRRILAKRTSVPRLTVRLVPGVYRWYVWPVYGSRGATQRGTPAVRSTITVAP